MKKVIKNFSIFEKELFENKGKQKSIYEGLIYSYDHNVITGKLLKFGYKNEDIGIEKSENGNVYIIRFDVNNGFEKLNGFMENLCGWNLSTISNKSGDRINRRILKDKKVGYVWLQYEPKFDKEVNINEVNNFLYHITTRDRFEKIKKIGLTPKTKSKFFSYNERIYLSDNYNKLIKLSQLFVKKRDKTEKNKVILDFIILKIDLNSLYLPIKLFVDPNFKNGYYTMENIDKYNIKPFKLVKLNNNGDILKNENI